MLASFRRSSSLFFQRDWPTARAYYARVESQTARLASTRARLLHIRSWLIGSFQVIFQSCPTH